MFVEDDIYFANYFFWAYLNTFAAGITIFRIYQDMIRSFAHFAISFPGLLRDFPEWMVFICVCFRNSAVPQYPGRIRIDEKRKKAMTYDHYGGQASQQPMNAPEQLLSACQTVGAVFHNDGADQQANQHQQERPVIYLLPGIKSSGR